MTTRGMPQIYSGDEIALDGGGDPDNRHDFPGGFPNSPAVGSSGFRDMPASAFTAAGRTPEQQEMFSTIQHLAELRKAHPTLACGAEQVLAKGPDLLAYTRYGTSGCPDHPPTNPPKSSSSSCSAAR